MHIWHGVKTRTRKAVSPVVGFITTLMLLAIIALLAFVFLVFSRVVAH